MIPAFAELGRAVESRWQARGYDELEFPAIAAQCLEELSPAARISYQDIVAWVAGADGLPPQRNIAATFGQPPITLYHGERFYIEALFWLDATPDIHQHGFSGAFQVLQGSSIHTIYDFQAAETINPRLVLGDLELRDVEALQRGDVRAIHPGKAFVHAAFHLEHPSVTIVVRTPGDIRWGPQFNYERTLAWDPFGFPARIKQTVRLLNDMRRLRHPDYERSLLDFLRNADLEALIGSVDMLSRLGDAELARATALAAAHHSRWGVVEPVLAESSRRSNIVLRRAEIRDPESRFLLALLLNVPVQAGILRLVGQRHPEGTPAATVVSWLRELSRRRLPGSDEPNVLGVATNERGELGEDALAIIEGLLERRSFVDISKSLAVQGHQFEPGEIADFHAALQASPILHPLFAE